MALTALACWFFQLVLSSISSPITQFIQLDFRVNAKGRGTVEHVQSGKQSLPEVCTCRNNLISNHHYHHHLSVLVQDSGNFIYFDFS